MWTSPLLTFPISTFKYICDPPLRPPPPVSRSSDPYPHLSCHLPVPSCHQSVGPLRPWVTPLWTLYLTLRTPLPAPHVTSHTHACARSTHCFTTDASPLSVPVPPRCHTDRLAHHMNKIRRRGPLWLKQKIPCQDVRAEIRDRKYERAERTQGECNSV